MTAKEKILIIDDERDLRSALASALNAAGYAAIEASNGEEGLSMARSEDPDLILLDINMPRMNGHQVLHELRLHPLPKDPHIILLTNNEDATNITRGVVHQTNDYIMKSQSSLNDILKRIKQHLAGYYDHS